MRLLCADDEEDIRTILQLALSLDPDLEVELVESGEAALARAQSGEIKGRLRAETEEAQRLGIFGAPSFIAAGELFWGNDRLEQALEFARRS